MATKPIASANAKPAGTGLLNPYAHLLAANPAAEGAPSDNANAKAEEKKSTVSAFHNPHLIKRPQAKSTRPAKKPAPKPAMLSSSSDASTVPTASAPTKLADFVSTAEQDAENDERRREENRLRKQQQKEMKKAKKKHGDWMPYEPYKLKYPTKIGFYKAHADMYPRLQMEFHDFLRAKNGLPPRLPTAKSSRGSSEPSQSRSVSPMAANSMFAPPLADETADTPLASAVDLPQTVEEMLAKRAQLAEQRGLVPISSRSPSPPPTTETAVASPPFRTPSLSPSPEPEVDPVKQATQLASQKRLDEIKRKIQEQMDLVNAREKARQSPSPSVDAPPPPPPPSASPPPPPPPQAPYNPTISGEPVRYTRPSPPAPPYNPTISGEPVRYTRPSPPAAQYNPTISGEPVRYTQPSPPAASYNPTISGEPVRYVQPSSPAQKKPADDEPLDDRPAKKRKQADEPKKPSKAELMMAKMGWKKGEGLGKDNDGIVSALNVKAGRNMGSDRVIASVTGGQRKQQVDQGRFGEPSKVVVSWGCVDGINFGEDAEREDGGIRQEMGDAFNNKFGEVERIHVDLIASSRPVYIKFKDHMSALNAVNRFFEGYKFQGRVIRAEFYDEKKFNASIYDH